MNDLIRSALAAMTLALALSGCAGGPQPEPEAPTLAEGGRIWANTCDRCHNLRPPGQFTAEEWPVIVSHMRTRADLTRREAEAVAAYLARVAPRGVVSGS
ncbi:MAG: cytochrome c [Gemmatimonadota bacterium]|jgi:hypothetical protein